MRYKAPLRSTAASCWTVHGSITIATTMSRDEAQAGGARGKTQKAEALNMCWNSSRRAGWNSPHEITFGTYAENWWVWGECPYLTSQAARGKTFQGDTLKSSEGSWSIMCFQSSRR